MSAYLVYFFISLTPALDVLSSECESTFITKKNNNMKMILGTLSKFFEVFTELRRAVWYLSGRFVLPMLVYRLALGREQS